MPDTIYTGDYNVRPFKILNKETGLPYDLTGIKVIYRCEREGQPSTTVFGYDSVTDPAKVVVTDAAGGLVEVNLDGTDTATLIIDASYLEQVRIEDEDTNKNVTLEQRFVCKRAF